MYTPDSVLKNKAQFYFWYWVAWKARQIKNYLQSRCH